MDTVQEIYGICHLSVVPIRMEPSDKAEIGSQLLFGDIFTATKKTEDSKWVYIETKFDEYLGWIDFKQYKEVSKEYFDTYNNTPSPMSKGLMGLMKGDKRFFPVMMGSTLPLLKNNVVRLDNEYYEFEGEFVYPQKTNAVFIEQTARFYLHSPYLWGGKCHFGIDCSGFVQQVYKLNGYELPRDSFKQAEVGQNIPFESMLPGDLAYFHNVNGRVIHVGIVLPGNQIIHASGEVRIDVLDENGIFNVDRKALYTQAFCDPQGIGRSIKIRHCEVWSPKAPCRSNLLTRKNFILINKCTLSYSNRLLRQSDFGLLPQNDVVNF